MIKHADDEQLQGAFKLHQQETKVHVERLEKLLKELIGKADDKKDPIITALISSGVNTVRESSSAPVRDAGMIATAQKIEHYEMASYGSARDWAKNLGLTAHVEVLQKTLDEEKHADHLLTTISQRENVAAAAAR